MASKKFLVDIDLNGNVIINGDTTFGIENPIAVTTLTLPAKTVGTYTLATTVNGVDADSTGQITIPVGGFNASALWKFSTTTTESDPGSGNIRFNHGTPASVTKIFIDDLTTSGADSSAYLSLLKTGDVIYIQQEDDSAKYLIATLTGNVTDNTGWFTLDVSIDDSGTIIDNNADTHVAMFKGGTGGGASELTDLSDVSGALVTNRFVLVANGSTYVGRALVLADISDYPTSVEAYITDGTAIALLNGTSNWDIDGNYTGAAITGTFQGQKHYNTAYFFEAVDDNDWIRLPRG